LSQQAFVVSAFIFHRLFVSFFSSFVKFYGVLFGEELKFKSF